MSPLVADPPPTLDPRQKHVLAACCVVAFAKLVDPQAWMMGLDIPASAFGTAWADYRIFSSINALVLIGFLLLGGVLGDALGRRRILIFGAGLATLANVVAVLAPSPPVFVVARAVEAFGSALALPMTLAILRLTFRGRALPLSLLIYTFVTVLGALASLLALVLVDRSGWQATLVLPITAGAVGTLLAWRSVPESRASGGDQVRRGIAAGAWSLVLLAFTIGLVALRQAWPNPITLVAVLLSAAGALALAISGRVHLRVAFSQRRRDQRRTFSVMLLASAALSLGLTGYLMQLYSFFTVVQGFGTILGGLALFPILLVCVPLARPIARLSVQAPSARLIAGGLACMGVALLFTSLLQPGMPYWPLALPMALFGIGFLLAQTAWNNAFLSALPTDLVGVSSGVSKAAAQAGTVLGTSLLGALVMQYGQADFARRLGDLGLSSEQIAQATNVVNTVLGADLPLGSTGAAVISPPMLFANGLMATYYESFTYGMAVALLWAALACLGVAVLVWLVLRGRRAAQPAPAGSVAPVESSASSGT